MRIGAMSSGAMTRAAAALALAATLPLSTVSGAQPAAAPVVTAADPLPTLSADQPLQCWWRASPGAVRVGQIVDVTLTCAVLESASVRAVPDESRLSVASVQLMPFEIVGGSHPPDVRAGDRRLFQYVYQVRLLGADVIGRDVKLPPLAIPYKVQSQAGAATAQAGRDLVHLMPQLAIRVVSQVPADAEDIRDSAEASLARIDTLRFRASAFGAGAMVLGALGLVAALGALMPAFGRLRTGRTKVAGRVSDSAVLRHAAGELDRLAEAATGLGWTPESLAAAHGAVRLTAAAVLRDGVRQVRLGPTAPVPEGRLLVRHRLRRSHTAVTAHVTGDALGRALTALPSGASATERTRLERLRDSLDALTRAQYVADASLDERAPIDDAVAAARAVALEVARERLWSPREWFRPAAVPALGAPGA